MPRTLEAPEEQWRGSSSVGIGESGLPGAVRAPRTIGDLSNPAGLADDAQLLPSMTSYFKAWYSEGATVKLAADAETTKWVQRVAEATTDDALRQVRSDFIAAYKLNSDEANGITAWMDLYKIDMDALKTGLPKLPEMKGFVYRAVDLPADTAKIFIEGLEGPISNGEKGIYQVEGM